MGPKESPPPFAPHDQEAHGVWVSRDANGVVMSVDVKHLLRWRVRNIGAQARTKKNLRRCGKCMFSPVNHR